VGAARASLKILSAAFDDFSIPTKLLSMAITNAFTRSLVATENVLAAVFLLSRAE
jgi:hypothetical protein